MQKIDKEFMLTDSSVNCYGFRLLTSGYMLNEFKRNPIGYFMHDRASGILVHWSDFRIENNDKVYAKPSINLSHPRGQRTVDEINNGFLNGASVGHIIMLEADETRLQFFLIKQGQTLPSGIIKSAVWLIYQGMTML